MPVRIGGSVAVPVVLVVDGRPVAVAVASDAAAVIDVTRRREGSGVTSASRGVTGGGEEGGIESSQTITAGQTKSEGQFHFVLLGKEINSWEGYAELDS